MSDTQTIDPPAPLKKHRSAASPDPYALIRRLIWLYLILWLIEGGLRRWVLPGLATPLLLIRDPLVVLIYFLAAAKNVFPLNGFVISGVVLAVLTFANAMAIGHGNPLVAAYGVRCDFLHVPLIFIMARVLRREDLLRLARVAVWLAIPYTALLVAQFYAPQTAWVNRGVGDSSEGAGFSGALDHFRPPGTFSFITGPMVLYPLFTACWFLLALARKIPSWLMIASGMAILVAIPVSISRGLFLSVVIVAVTGVAALFVGGRLSGSLLLRALLAAVLIPILAGQLGAFKTGMQAFEARWQDSTTDAGGFQEAIVDRVVDGFTGPFQGVEFLGAGTGYSTNVGQKLLTDKRGFGGSEGEWGRLLYDNGFILGTLLVGYRLALAGAIVLAAFQAWRRRSPEGLIFASAAFLLVLQGQWGQASAQGAATIAGGLTLAAAAMETKRPRTKRLKDQKSEDGGQGAKVEEAPFSVTKPTHAEDEEQRGAGGEVRRQRTDGSVQKSEDRRQKSEGSAQSPEDGLAPFSVTKHGQTEDHGQPTSDHRETDR